MGVEGHRGQQDRTLDERLVGDVDAQDRHAVSQFERVGAVLVPTCTVEDLMKDPHVIERDIITTAAGEAATRTAFCHFVVELSAAAGW